ncbi:MAG: MoaD/ThiS family protein [Ferroplasma sp.]
MEIKMLYFAHVRDITGKSGELFDLNGNTLQSLKIKIFEKYPNLEKENNLLIAVNNEYVKECNLKENDTVAFFPPVSGG